MALLGSDFNPTTPRDADAVSNGAAEIRDLKRRLKDFVSVKFDPETGQFKSASSNITLASSDPSNPNLGDVYFNTVSLTAFVFTTSGWLPLQRSSLPFSQQYFSASGSFTVPDGITRIRVHAWGAGGGGAAWNGAASSAGGGGGAYGCSIVTVTAGQVIAFTVGTGGTGGVGSGNAPGADGGNTTIAGGTAGGGKGGTAPGSIPLGGAGGTASGFDINFTGETGGSAITGVGASFINGGAAAGGGGSGGVPAANSAPTGRHGVAPGGGGASGQNASDFTSGDGANGAVIIEY